MDQSKIDQFALLNGEKFAMEHIVAIKERLKELDDSKFAFIVAQDYKKPITMLLISIFLGFFAVDRFLLGHIGLGIAKLLLGWLTIGIWFIVDLFLIQKATRKANFEKFQRAAMM